MSRGVNWGGYRVFCFNFLGWVGCFERYMSCFEELRVFRVIVGSWSFGCIIRDVIRGLGIFVFGVLDMLNKLDI